MRWGKDCERGEIFFPLIFVRSNLSVSGCSERWSSCFDMMPAIEFDEEKNVHTEQKIKKKIKKKKYLDE